MPSFNHLVTNEQDLRAVIGVPSPRSVLKERRSLDEHTRAFIARSPFLLMATSDANGRCDVSPKGDGPGFVQVLDDQRIVIPERPGNKRFDGMLNIMANPHVGLIFLVPGRQETLRVNGKAWITRDPQLLEPCVAHGKVPLVAIAVEIEQCFLHCPKAFVRSRLWNTDAWPAADSLPSMACVLFDQIKPADATLEDYERSVEEGITKGLY
jgi:PPOX class probable FMN-dependent enzyme, DR_2398 family